MASYQLVASEPSIKVLSPTSIIETVRATIATLPTGIQATYEVPAASFGPSTAGGAPSGQALLDVIAEGIESLVEGHHVIGGQPAQDFDQNGLLQDYTDLIVAYTPAGSVLPPLTAIAHIPIDNYFLAETGIGGLSIPGPGGGTPADIADTTYNQLVALAGG